MQHKNQAKTTLRNKGIAISLFCLLPGILLIYYQGYKDNSFIQYAATGLIYIGWAILSFSVFGKILFKDKKAKFSTQKKQWLKENTIRLLIIAFFAIGILETVELPEKLGRARVIDLLKNEPTENTTATIIKIETRHTRGGWRFWAIIEYEAKTGKVQQAVYDYNEKYVVGQKYGIRYSVEYPEMFEITGQQQ